MTFMSNFLYFLKEALLDGFSEYLAGLMRTKFMQWYQPATKDDEEANERLLPSRNTTSRAKGKGKLGLLSIKIPSNKPFIAEGQRVKDYVKRERKLRDVKFERTTHFGVIMPLPAPTRGEDESLLRTPDTPAQNSFEKPILAFSDLDEDDAEEFVRKTVLRLSRCRGSPPSEFSNSRAQKRGQGPGKQGLLRITVPPRSPCIGVRWQHNMEKRKQANTSTQKPRRNNVQHAGQDNDSALDLWLEIYDEDAKARAMWAGSY